jgi:chorismate mutase / prephenate dehydratase
MSRQRTLDEVRAEIDSIDDAIQDLLIRRTALVEEVRAIKRDWRVKIQPSREADIIYRLVERHHGSFPKRDLVAIWRILICATLSFEGPFSVAVHVAREGDASWDIARDHFGPCTEMRRHGSSGSVIEAVRRQEAIVGVLPMPRHDDADPWWRHLMSSDPNAPRIIARLPFADFSDGGAGGPEALVICPVNIAPTGRDRSYLAAESERQLELDQLRRAVRQAGLAPSFAARWRDGETPGAWLYLAEVDGWLAPDDARLQRLRQTMDAPPNRLLPVGGYAEPLTREMLGPPPSAAHRLRAAKGANAAAL